MVSKNDFLSDLKNKELIPLIFKIYEEFQDLPGMNKIFTMFFCNAANTCNPSVFSLNQLKSIF